MPIDITNKEEKQIALTGTQIEETLLQAHLSKAAIEKIEGLVASASEIDGSVNLAHPALSHFIYGVTNATTSMSILVNSDSTGNADNEWVYYFAQWLANKYPKFTVRYRVWDDAINSYANPSLMNAGTSSIYMDVWNFAVSGTKPSYILGLNKIDNGLKNITNKSTFADVSDVVDLVIVNHSHNVTADGRYVNTELDYAMFTERALEIHPFSSMMMIRQNPLRDSYSNESRMRAAVNWAINRNFCIADVWSKFEDLSKASYLYADNTHPSVGLGETGTQLFLDAITEQLNKKLNASAGFGFDSLNNLVTRNVIPNGNFSVWTNTSLPPEGFNVSGGTCSKDTTQYADASKKYSLKVTATGGAVCNVVIEISSTAFGKIKGGWYTASVLMRVNGTVGNSGTAGRLSTITSSDSSSSAPVLPWINGEWHWRYSRVFLKTTDTYVRIYIYVESDASTLAGQYINIDSIIFAKGKMPFGSGI